MDPRAMAPFGVALGVYAEGDTDAELSMRRDDGLSVSIRGRQANRRAGHDVGEIRSALFRLSRATSG